MENYLTKRAPVPSQRSSSIDLFRLICSILIIGAHSLLFKDVSPTLQTFTYGYVIRFTLSFFYAVSGYYFIGALLDGKKPLKKQLISTLRPYAVWTLIYYTASFFINVVKGGEPFGQFLIERVVFFFTKGSYTQLWYFPALIYSMLITAAAYSFWGKRGIKGLAVASVALYVFGVLGSGYYNIGKNIPLLSNIFAYSEFPTIRGIFCMGLPYFVSGYVVRLLNEKIPTKRACNVLFGICGACYLAEAIVLMFALRWTERSEQSFSIYALTCLLVVFLLRNPMPQFAKSSDYAKQQSGFVFFAHELFIVGFPIAALSLGLTIHSVVLYLLVVAASLAVGHLCIRFDNPVTRLLLGKSMASQEKKPMLPAQPPSGEYGKLASQIANTTSEERVWVMDK